MGDNHENEEEKNRKEAMMHMIASGECIRSDLVTALAIDHWKSNKKKGSK